MERPAIDTGPRLLPPRAAAGARFSGVSTGGQAVGTISRRIGPKALRPIHPYLRPVPGADSPAGQ